ncbi:MAG: DNA repair and recombination protein RadB [Candidatus Aenigmatarchaeota archaeon]|nr:MAG: DNA repair and recombination protein RadB [Candidatus Aenigmarchaeota archaeon]
MAKKLNLPQPLQSLMQGIEHGALTNFYGAPGTGKTNLCMLTALEIIKNGGKVIFIDTEGGFSHERLSQLYPNAEGPLKNIFLLEPKNFKEQGKMIREMPAKQADMIIIDSAVALYRLEYSDPEKEALPANRELSKQMSVLSSLARERDIPIIVTSHTYKNWDTDKHEIVGGDAVKYWAKAMVFLERTGKMAERSATMIKHRSIPEGKSVKFEIVNEGIKPASGFKLF